MATPDAEHKTSHCGWVAKVGISVALLGPCVGGCLWLVWLVLGLVNYVQDAADRSHGALKQLTLAMFEYSEDKGMLPPAAVFGKDGRPLLSWRVLILPYLGEEELFKEFRLDEPWDSPHNLTLLSRRPPAFAPPPGKRSKVPPDQTVCHVFVGKGAAFEGRKGLRLPRDFPDGSGLTILIIEAGKPVPWTKPEEIPYDPDGPLPELHCLFKDSFRVGMGDGSVRFVRKDISAATLRAAITRNGNDILGDDW